ncbi:MAG TPA: GNAT family N-acetyltransferase, partial [Chloroflexota bacterium]|nr:GNAT family N-acetyltransferase [Chloroflexota bacterium]
HDSWARRNLSDAYLILLNGLVAGYAAVANKYDKGAVCEFYVIPRYRASAQQAFRALIDASGATKVMAQTNDNLLLLMLYDFTKAITSDTILFADALTTHLTRPSGHLRRVTDEDRASLFAHHSEPPGEWAIEHGGQIVATAGALYHYNPPYGDIYMEVDEAFRRMGFGSYLVQEVKRVCYEIGKVPAARTSTANVSSRRTLQKAGLLPCARILIGKIAK